MGMGSVCGTFAGSIPGLVLGEVDGVAGVLASAGLVGLGAGVLVATGGVGVSADALAAAHTPVLARKARPAAAPQERMAYRPDFRVGKVAGASVTSHSQSRTTQHAMAAWKANAVAPAPRRVAGERSGGVHRHLVLVKTSVLALDADP